MKWLVAGLLFFVVAEHSFAESGLRYGYYKMTTNYEYYTGHRSSDVTLNIHDFQLSDSSGAFSAGLQTAANRTAAEAGAINEENRKIEKGESLGGPKTLTYEYEEAQAKAGDSKVYGLRLGSTDNPFSSEAIFGDSSDDGLITYVELSLGTGITGGTLMQTEQVSLRWNSSVTFRFGGIKQTETSAEEKDDRFRDAAFFYLPVTGQLLAAFSIPLHLGIESGLDPVTLVRQVGGVDIPLDIYHSVFAEYRIDMVGIGIHMERYNGSLVGGDDKDVKNPVYSHQMIGAYVVLGM